MKFAATLIAIGAHAVKLQEDEDNLSSWETRSTNMHRVLDWDGSGTVDREELQDLIIIAEAFEYITADEAAEYTTTADMLFTDVFSGPFSVEELHDFVYSVIDGEDNDEDWDYLEDIETLLMEAEEMALDAAVAIAFDELDED